MTIITSSATFIGRSRFDDLWWVLFELGILRFVYRWRPRLVYEVSERRHVEG